MGIKQQIQEHTALAYKLAYEKVKLLGRVEAIDKEIIHYEGVINAFEHVVKMEETANGSILDNDKPTPGNTPGGKS